MIHGRAGWKKIKPEPIRLVSWSSEKCFLLRTTNENRILISFQFETFRVRIMNVSYKLSSYDFGLDIVYDLRSVISCGRHYLPSYGWRETFHGLTVCFCFSVSLSYVTVFTASIEATYEIIQLYQPITAVNYCTIGVDKAVSLLNSLVKRNITETTIIDHVWVQTHPSLI